MTEAIVTDLIAAFNEWLEESGSTLRMTWPDGELIAQVLDTKAAFPTFDP